VNLPRTLSFLVFILFAAIAAADPADSRREATAACAFYPVHEHVREQFAQFGPLSTNREYFGFIYLFDGKLASAVARGHECRSEDRCITRIAGAARAIPKGAQLLGEWHTHPKSNGSRSLSADDVHGARHHHRIPCYQAFYSTPRGELYAWDVAQSSVSAAMATRVHLGNLSDARRVNDAMRVAQVP
jgi:hypothetical protein